MAEDAIEIQVVLYADGSSALRIPPLDDTQDQPALLRRAAKALTRAARAQGSEREPVRCPLCGTPATAATATPDGQTVLSPCQHTVG